jgi:hypothetical protein
LEEAVRLYDEAGEAWEKFPLVLEHGLASLGAGRCLVGLGRNLEAAARLRAGREVLSGLGARPSMAEADALLERAVARTS